MRRAFLVALLLVSAIPWVQTAVAHEVRPAYLQIEEISLNRFNILWKQPSQGDFVLRLEPRLSNGILDTPPDVQHLANGFMIRRWNNRQIDRTSLDGATLKIAGLERTLTDALINIQFANGHQIQRIVKPIDPQLTIHLSQSGTLAVPAYLTLGIEHILTGFDHLAFVLGMVLLVTGRWRILTTITAFTLAHSITLAIAALGYVQFNVPLIESLVALSIVFVAVELVRSWRGHTSLTTRYPWLIAFSFGLLHGFAFAGSLADIGLPSHNVPAALLLFNLGVEIGQLMFVGAVLGLSVIFRRRTQTKVAGYGRWAVAYGVGMLASYWMIERIIMIQ